MRVLIIQTAFLGDVILTTPLLKAIHERWPDSELHVVSTPIGCQALSGLERVYCHSFDKRAHGFIDGIRLVKASLSDFKFDFIFTVHRSFRSLWLAKQLKATHRIAFTSFWSRALRFQTVDYPEYAMDTHYSDKPLALLAVMGDIPTKKIKPWLAVSKQEAENTQRKFSLDSSYIVLSPFSAWGTKMWFADRFARVATEIAMKKKVSVVITGDSNSRDLVTGQAIAEKITSGGGRAINLVGKTSIAELKAIIRGAKTVLTNDSAPVHIAAAFDTPTVAIFGPTVKKWGFFPLSSRSVVVERSDVDCRPCSLHGPQKCPKRHFECMDKIQTSDVYSAVERVYDLPRA